MSYDAARPLPNTPEEQIAQLVKAGWKQVRSTVFKSPSGQYYRGPYGAWCHMKGIKCEVRL